MHNTYPDLCARAEDIYAELIQLSANYIGYFKILHLGVFPVFPGALISKVPVLEQGDELSGGSGILWQISLPSLTEICHDEQYLKMKILKHWILREK